MTTPASQNKPLPKPEAPEGYTVVMCWKCSGTGFFCMGTNNGKPYSLTGFDCWPCNGTGWRTRRKPRKLGVCPTCSHKIEKVDGRLPPHGDCEGGEPLPRAEVREYVPETPKPRRRKKKPEPRRWKRPRFATHSKEARPHSRPLAIRFPTLNVWLVSTPNWVAIMT